MPQLNKALVNRILEKNDATSLYAIEGMNYEYFRELNDSKEARQQLHKVINIICQQVDSLEIRNVPDKTLTAIQKIIQKNSPCFLKELIIFEKHGHTYEDLSDQVEPYIWFPSEIDAVITENILSPAASPPPLSRIPSITRVDTASSSSSRTSPSASPVLQSSIDTDFETLFLNVSSPEPSPTHTNLSLKNAFILHDLEQKLFIHQNEMLEAIKNYEDRTQAYLWFKDSMHSMLAQIKIKKLIPQRFYKAKVPLPKESLPAPPPPDSGLFSFLLPQAPDLGEREISAPKTPVVTDDETVYELTPLKIGDKNTNPIVISYKDEYEKMFQIREANLEIKKSIMLAAKQAMELKISRYEEMIKEIEAFKTSVAEAAVTRQKFFKSPDPILRPSNPPRESVPTFTL
jgi:hypothetical protein